MVDYSIIDRAILNSIECGHSPIYNFYVAVAAEEIAHITGRKEFRIIDARIQRLRRAGFIKYKRSTRKWEVL